eukprot:TRINITY_DN4155_c0_g2_i2.p1 TRINITY_DN4155_c0_g2~~TRINITY_DN4155_c0_g2_i2.p1  ORF type:complete len:149 (+),score=11.45 TRINITY_DN4155_c0_g2_i2:35-448(+)
MDLKKQLAFYGEFHHSYWNKIVHIACVPLIQFTAFLMIAQTAHWFQINIISDNYYTAISVSSILMLLHAIYYCLLDLTMGIVASLIFLIEMVIANWFVFNEPSLISPIFGISQIFGWAAQLSAHKVGDHYLMPSGHL